MKTQGKAVKVDDKIVSSHRGHVGPTFFTDFGREPRQQRPRPRQVKSGRRLVLQTPTISH